MSNGWEISAQAWIDSMGARGDWAREHVLDPVMLGRVGAGRFRTALDVGCGEGRFCRLLKAAGVTATGIDPTAALLETASQRGHGVDVPGTGETECAESCHGDLRDIDGAGPLSVRRGSAVGFGATVFGEASAVGESGWGIRLGKW